MKRPLVAKSSKRTVRTMVLPVQIRRADILAGQDCLPVHCMEKIGITNCLEREFGLKPYESRVRVADGHVYFNCQGYRWRAPWPRILGLSLKAYDDAGAKARRNRTEFKPLEVVKPHRYTLKAQRESRLARPTRARQDQINEARRKRIKASGQPRKQYGLRRRLVGFSVAV